MSCDRIQSPSSGKAYLKGCKIDTIGNFSALCNMDLRGLGNGAGEHNEAQQEAGDLEEVHDYLFVN